MMGISAQITSVMQGIDLDTGLRYASLVVRLPTGRDLVARVEQDAYESIMALVPGGVPATTRDSVKSESVAVPAVVRARHIRKDDAGNPIGEGVVALDGLVERAPGDLDEDGFASI